MCCEYKKVSGKYFHISGERKRRGVDDFGRVGI